MSQGTLSMAVDGPDDLPRTLRRAREERMREAEAEQAALQQPQLHTGPAPSAAAYSRAEPIRGFGEAAEAVTVDAIRVPFFRLMAFFIKAVIAAIPAIVLLGVLLWVGGYALKTWFPHLVHMQITIAVPK